MSYAPKTITAAAAVWTKHGGLNSGIVGNAAHKYGYHIGKDRIYSAAGQHGADYSVSHPRDKAGLSNAASALDLGHANKAILRKFSVWLVNQCIKKAPGTADIREIIYSADGKTVHRYEASNGKIYLGGNGTGQGDNSHLWHTHISWYRDSEFHEKASVFAKYWAVVPAPVVPPVVVPPPPVVAPPPVVVPPPPAPVPVPAPKPVKKFYTVKAGNTLGGIAYKFHLTLAELLAFPENKQYRANPGLIHAGDKVRYA